MVLFNSLAEGGLHASLMVLTKTLQLTTITTSLMKKSIHPNPCFPEIQKYINICYLIFTNPNDKI